MSDSDDEGFKLMPPEIDIKPVVNITNFKYSSLLQLKPPVSLFFEQPLFQYPHGINDFKCTTQQPIMIPCNHERALGISKQENNATFLSQYFPRRLTCVYNRFKESTSCKRDLTLLIRNVARHVRREQTAPFLPSLPTPPPRKPTALSFSAEFEGGNLHFVFREPKEPLYYLLLQNDVNTHGFNFWFHFQVKAHNPGKYTFVIVNLAREVQKLEGQQSLLTYHPDTDSYRRIVGFKCSESRFTRCDSARNYWSLQFEYQFKENEQVYMSLTYPYSYSKLIQLLKIVPNNHPTLTCLLQLAAKSELGNEIPYLKVSSRINPSKRVILVTARQHPSETVGSYLCHALITTLIDSTNLTATALLQRFTICILPMINPDGVIHGNSRTNLLGYDLNRCWTRAELTQSRECQRIWTFIEETIKSEGKICWSIDLHGHSRELGFFAYFGQKNQRSLLLNEILANKSVYFQKEKSAFQVEYSKRQSIRGQLSQRMRVDNAVTIETSMWGYRDAEGRFKHFQGEHFQQMSNSILESIIQTENKIQTNLLQEQNCQIFKNSLKSRPPEQQPEQILDSDSNPEEDYLLNEERKQVQSNFINIEVSDLQVLSPKANRRHLLSEPVQSTIYLKKGQGLLRNSKRQTQMMAFSKGMALSNSEKRQGLRSANKLYTGQKRQSASHNFLNIRTKIAVTPTRAIYSRNEQPPSCQIQLKKQPTQRQYIRKKRSKTQPDNQDLRQSLQMRRRFRMAFENKSRVGQSRQQASCFEQEVCELKAIVYPTVSNRKIETRKVIRQKRDRMREIRVSQYGVTVIRQFHDTLYMRNFKMK